MHAFMSLSRKHDAEDRYVVKNLASMTHPKTNPCDPVYFPQGHFEFFMCDIGDLDDPAGVPDQECFNRYPLTRAPEANAASQIDPNYPGRYYVDPECRKNEVEQNVSDNIPDDAYSIKMRYTLPNIECEHCILQMHYREEPSLTFCAELLFRAVGVFLS